MVFIWLIWTTTIFAVIRRDLKLREEELKYEEPQFIYALLFIAFPLVIAWAGNRFLKRTNATDVRGMVDRAGVQLIRVLTVITLFALLGCGLWVLDISCHRIRE